jgi:uncharacterized protein YndB with AHSA1/START domain
MGGAAVGRTMPGAVAEVDTIEAGPDRIRLLAHLPQRAPELAFRDWTDAGRIRAWWGPEASIDLREGGEYVFRWKRIPATLRGRYSRVEPGRWLAFSWVWDEEPERRSEVTLEFRPDGAGGTELEVTQGPYSADPHDQELRRQHLEGWRFHLPKLIAAAATPTTSKFS